MKKDNIYVFKFVGSYEVIAKFLKMTDDGDYVVAKPLNPVPVGQNENGMEFQLLPMFMCIGDAEKTTLFKHQMLCTPQVVPAETEKNYLQQTTTIQLV